MNIYIDATALLRKPDGVGRYASSIVSALVEMDKDNNYRALGFADDRRRFHAINKDRLTYEYLPLLRRVYQQWFKRVGPVSVNRWLKRRPDVVFYPNFVNFPKIKDAKSIVVIHDVAFIEEPGTLPERNFGRINRIVPRSLRQPNLSYLEEYVPKAIKQADAVVAVSEETQAAIAQRYGINASQITVAPNAVDERFYGRVENDTKQAIRVRYGLPDEYILFVGTIEPRKNVGRLIEAYANLPAALKEKYPLVLAGRPGWNNELVYKRIHELMGEGNTIMAVGFVEDEDLPAIYNMARTFVFPSIHEGFGLPILEAMAARTAVICSDKAPMNRLAEDGALFIDPEDPVSMTSAMKKVLGDPKLAKSMIEKGQRVAKKHTWEASAQTLHQLIESLK